MILDLNIHNGHAWDEYLLKREWSLSEEAFEVFSVTKNGISMGAEEIGDFENYLLNLIPPELFDLYFFDGEQIADYFLENSGNERVKQAFLTLCGYDIFDVLYKNFKKISKVNVAEDDVLLKYLDIEDALSRVERKCKECMLEIESILNEIESKNSALIALEEKYTMSGGVTIAEWNEKILELKKEERFRDDKNAWLKIAANEIIPYIILHGELKALLNQMEQERESEQIMAAKEVLTSLLPDVMKTVGLNREYSTKIALELEQKLSTNQLSDFILCLSKEEYSKLSTTIALLLSYKKEEIFNAREEIRKSINRSKRIRGIIDSSNVEGIDSFLREKESLIAEREKLYVSREEYNEQLKELLEEKSDLEQEYRRISKELDKQLKSQSVNSLSAKAIIFLEELQRRLFRSEIRKVEELFMQKMNQLMRKRQFIDSIAIDDDFNIHIYKRVVVDCKGVSEKIRVLTPAGYEKEYGALHCEDILKVSKCENLEAFARKYYSSQEIIDVMVEFDKTIMSKGEKQVFIMSLYWAMMKLCSKEIPFIIDTPFARIDTEHRAHITEYFFKELSGQVFIFSTNEEITAEHVKVIGDDLQATFLIENVDNKRTTIHANKYFGD